MGAGVPSQTIKGMNYYCTYNSPIGELLLVSDGAVLTGLFFDPEKQLKQKNQETTFLRYSPERLESKDNCEAADQVFDTTGKWLDLYFQGKEPDFMPELAFCDTPFREEVWSLLREIPYGQTVSYGDLAKKLETRRGIKRMSAQAVGGAVGKNPISIIIPCHRVIGTDGSMIGYGGGLDKKKYLLELEGIQ